VAEEARRLLVTTGPPGRHIAISELPAEGRFVADDLTEGRRLGDLNGDAQPFLITIEDRPHLVLAGHAPGPGADRVEISSSTFTQMRLVKNNVWATMPEPFTDGMQIAITWNKGDSVLSKCHSGPLHADALEPMFGPDWTGYAPVD
jgi:hypothetical protein